MSGTQNQGMRDVLTALRQDPKNDDLWKVLYGEIRRFVYAVAYRVLGGNAELAKDATQIVFLRLFQYCEFTEFSEPEEFLGYVATITRHASLDLLHSERGYVTGLELTLSDLLPGPASPRERERAQNQLHDVLEHLEPGEKALVQLLMEGFTLEEIAAHLRIRYTTAAVRIHRLRQKLLKLLIVG